MLLQEKNARSNFSLLITTSIAILMKGKDFQPSELDRLVGWYSSTITKVSTESFNNEGLKLTDRPTDEDEDVHLIILFMLGELFKADKYFFDDFNGIYSF